MFKIALNAGHGINTPGKRCLKSIDNNETREWSLNSRICKKIEEKLAEYSGYDLIRVDDTTGNTDIPLKQRTDKANKFGADFYLSIHHNAGVNGGSGGGVIAIVYKSIKDVSNTSKWQKALYDSVIQKTGLKGNRAVPLQRQNLHEVRETKMPAVILECGFMDSTTDTPIILSENFAEKVASACAEVLISNGGLTKKASSTVKTEEKQPITPSVNIDCIAMDVIRGLYGNGNERKQRLSALGLNYSEIQKRVNEILKGR